MGAGGLRGAMDPDRDWHPLFAGLAFGLVVTIMALLLRTHQELGGARDREADCCPCKEKP